MPNIREYNSSETLQGIRPNELGADALAQSGRRIESVYRQAGEDIRGGINSLGQVAERVGQQIDQHDAMQEISTGAAGLANITSKLTDQWNQTANSSDLNDHSIADKFHQDTLEPALEQWQQGFTTKAGQKWALERADALRNHFFEKTSADMATRAGDALVANLNTTLNASSNMARNDPSSMAFAMDQYESALRASAANSNADPRVVSKVITEQLQKGKSQIAQSAMIGMAQNNPDSLDAAINKGTFNDYLDGSQIKTMQAYAHSQKSQQQVEFRNNSKAVSDEYTQSTYDPIKQKVQAVTPELFGKIMSDQRLTEADKRSTVRFLQQQFKAQQSEARQSNPAILSQFQTRFRGDPSNYPTKEEIGVAMGRGDLSSPDAHILLDAAASLTNTKDPIATKMLDSALKSVHAQILGVNTPGDKGYPAAESAAARFDSWFWPNYQRAIANGASPEALLSPDSPSYMLKPDTLKQFALKPDDIVQPPANRPAVRPPLSSFFGAPKAQAQQPPKNPAKPMTDEEVIKAGGA